ncbi:Alpha-D-ribose 1-methylphosphonate 5-triphosphate synthase subunit PhnH [Roseovarius sp. THAF27]|uniref:phosphonate C-P lyase system protein PhnH n=1 Tax=Roseovarius sp. THAF27 TaxID=2587850 RepID=UPI001267FC26|nr:phosphonate C-P lyase system protein PhnH [Roseovarius sp. THAF27]QFT82288.1 Alpha-D-ribose 1-methylphosphonate 5-triphosphate synthase subunit PhnH [Roseovarius sp. THAF27]
MHTEALTGGFGDAPVDAARAFRGAMNAMARPGRIEDLAGAVPPAPLSVAAGVLVLTLCDAETPVYLAGDHDAPAVREWITFHTGAPFAGPEAAMFALGSWEALRPLEAYPVGTPEYPDRSTTLIVEVPELVADGAVLSGPGIRETARLSLPEVAAFQRNASAFPLGLDFFFTCGDRVAALPRTTQVEG